jgi:hypothetical protein
MTRFPEMTVTVAASILIGETQLAEKQFDKLKFAGSAGETRGVPRFDFRDLVLAEETLSERCNKLLGPA